MLVPNHIIEIINDLSRDAIFYQFTEFEYPKFAQSVRKYYFKPSTLSRPLNDNETQLLLRFDRQLMTFWAAFPSQLQFSSPITKDLSFFFTTLFGNMKPHEQKTFLNIWALISKPFKSQGNLTYFVPGDFLNFFSVKTRKQRVRLAKKLLSLFDESIVSSNGLVLDIDRFIEEFHKFAFSSPVKLTYNDLCLLHVIINKQTSDQTLLASECKLNKNTVSSRFNWLVDKHILYHRYRIAFDLFKLRPLIVAGYSENTTENLKDDSDIWLLSQFEGSENKRLCFLLAPTSYDKNLLIEHYSKKKFIKTSLTFDRISSLTFISHNLSLYDPTLQRWDILQKIDDLTDSKPYIYWPFKQSFDEDRNFRLTKRMIHILNYFRIFPQATRRKAANYLKISTSTLARHLNYMCNNNLIIKIFGLYPLDLHIFAHFIIRIKSESEIAKIVKHLGLYVPIIHGGGLKGEYLAMDLQIPFQQHKEIYDFHALLQKHNYDLVWQQVNENAYASHWTFPIKLWDEKKQVWTNNRSLAD